MVYETPCMLYAAVASLCHVSSVLVAGSLDGGVSLYNLADLQVPILGATPRPQLLRTLEASCPIRHVRPPPPRLGPAHSAMALTAGGQVLWVDVARGGGCVTHQGALSTTAESFGAYSTFLGMSVVLLQGAPPPAPLPANPADPGVPPETPVAAPQYPEPALEALGPLSVSARELMRGRPTHYHTVREVREGEGDSAYGFTLPGEVVGLREGGTMLVCSHSGLHRYVAPQEQDKDFKSGRTGRILVEGVRYQVEDVECHPDGTLIKLSTAFHRAVERGERGLTIQAALKAVHVGQESRDRCAVVSRSLSAGSGSGLTAICVHPFTNHVVLAFGYGGHQVLGCERY
jgi:uncharacterized ParB-like nuclease family protein